MGAAFLSAGGYHHHIGMNTWHSLNGEVHTNCEAGLEKFTITIPDESFVNALALRVSSFTNSNQVSENQLLVSDPDGIQFTIRSQ
jgi:catechol 2,3-dioxygenase